MSPRFLQILWPAFLMAGVLEMLVFAVVDPEDLRWLGAEAIPWSRQAVYTFTFMILWGGVSIASTTTALLMRAPADVNRGRRS